VLFSLILTGESVRPCRASFNSLTVSI
jgi:hypothetical protein